MTNAEEWMLHVIDPQCNECGSWARGGPTYTPHSKKCSKYDREEEMIAIIDNLLNCGIDVSSGEGQISHVKKAMAREARSVLNTYVLDKRKEEMSKKESPAPDEKAEKKKGASVTFGFSTEASGILNLVMDGVGAIANDLLKLQSRVSSLETIYRFEEIKHLRKENEELHRHLHGDSEETEE
jgi:hypothetical protein